MKKMTKLMRAACVVSLVPLVLLALCWRSLPAQVPTNWGFDGTVTYSDKWNLLLVACMSPLFAVLLPLAARIDPRRQNVEKFRGSFDLFCLVLQLFLLVINGIILIESYRPGTVDVKAVVMLGVGLMFAVLGNIAPRFRHNYFIGLRTPWTLASETVWTRTHRLYGRLMFALGLVMMAAAFLPSTWAFAVAIGGVIVLSLSAYVYSYVCFQQEQRAQDQT